MRPEEAQALVGRMIWLDEGFDLLTEKGTLWRPGRKAGRVVSVETGKFYQTLEPVTWLKVRLTHAHGRYCYAQAYLNENTGALIKGARWGS